MDSGYAIKSCRHTRFERIMKVKWKKRQIYGLNCDKYNLKYYLLIYIAFLLGQTNRHLNDLI